MYRIGKISFILIIILVLFACVTYDGNENRLNSLIGASKSDIIAQFGKPSAIKIIDNNTQVLAYTRADKVFVPSEFYTYDQGNEIYGQDGLFSPFLNTYLFSDNGGDLGYEVKYICKTLFVVQNNHVSAWKQQGNDCADSLL